MKSPIIFSPLTILAILSMPCHSYAQESETNNKSEHGEFHKNHLAIFNGATTNLTHEATNYTAGFDYERRFSEKLGAGILGECIFAESKEYLAGIPVVFHCCKELKLIGAPMAVIGEEHDEITHESKQETSFAFRIGAGYDFHVAGISIGPVVNYDYGKTQALNYGLIVGFGF